MAAENLAVEAYRASGCKTHAEFIALFGGAIGLRTFRDWLAGKVVPPLAQLVLREVIAGWRPSCRP